MKNEHPILMKTEMVRAALADLKTQTRRVINFKMWKEAPVISMTEHFEPFTDSPKNYQCWSADHKEDGFLMVEQELMCPYGFIGHTLYVREAWRIVGWNEDGDWMIEYKDGSNKWFDSVQEVT